MLKNCAILIAMLIVAGNTNAATAPADLTGAGTIHRVERPNRGEYNVFMTSDYKHRVAANAQTAVDHVGGKLREVWENLGAFHATLTEGQAKALSHLPSVDFVSEDGVLDTATLCGQVLPPDASLWHLARIQKRLDQYSAYPTYGTACDRYFTCGTQGAGATIYIVDSGITAGHTEFVDANWQSRVIGARNFTSVGGLEHINDDPPPAVDPNDTSDGFGHGTMVASAAAGKTVGVARDSKLYSLKVINSSGQADSRWVISALNWLLTPGNYRWPGLVNISVASGLDSAFDAAVTAVIQQNITVITAAGNGNTFIQHPDSCTKSPGHVSTINVGATTSMETIQNYTATGNCVTLWAPGDNMKVANNAVTLNGYEIASGTSLSSPLVAGVAATVVARNPNYTPAQVRAAILGNADTLCCSAANANYPMLFISGHNPDYYCALGCPSDPYCGPTNWQ